jgi:hypothetical protein
MMKLNRWLRSGAAVIAAAAIQLVPMQEAAAEPHSAADMLAECQALLSSAKATADPDAIELDNSFSTGSCWGAFLSIQQLVTLRQAGSRTPMFRVCVPEDATLVQIIKIFESFARRHPEREGEPFTIVAIAGLHEAFRCR